MSSSIIVLLAGAAAGYRMGLVRSLLGLVGVVAGGIGAYFAIPLVVAWIPSRSGGLPASSAPRSCS